MVSLVPATSPICNSNVVPSLLTRNASLSFWWKKVRLKRGFFWKSASNFAVAAHQSHVVAAVKIDALIGVVFEFQRDDEGNAFSGVVRMGLLLT